MLRLFRLVLLCLVVPALSGCAELDRQFDIALYGSVEEGQKAREEMRIKQAGVDAERQPKIARELFKKINEARAKNGVRKAESWNEDLRELAQLRAREIAQVYDKTRPNGKHYATAYDEFKKLEHFKYSRTRELRARGLSSADSALRHWLTSAETRKEILDPRLLYFSVGLYIEDGKYYWIFWSIKS